MTLDDAGRRRGKKMDDQEQTWAVFWCSLLSPLLFGEVPEHEAFRFLSKLAREEHLFPDGRRKKASLSTLQRKWRQYRQGGFAALPRKARSDRGRPRQHRQAMIDKAIELKKDQPRRSDHTINQFLDAEFGRTIPPSTLYRHLKQAAATRLKLDVSSRKVRCRWSREQTHALWLGDFQDGPYVLCDGQAVPTFLSAFIDCYSRFAVEARYYRRENLDILTDSLLRAWATHGASRELYLDNAKIYHAHALQAACFQLNIRLIHRGVGDPPPGGLIERFFGTTQSQFEAEVRAGAILTFDQLNRGLAAWLDTSYHARPNSETGQSPRQRYQQGLAFVRHVDLQQVLPLFLQRASRKVHPDFSDVQLQGCFFKVDPRLRGDSVELRYDPFAPLERVLIYSERGQYLGSGERYQRELGAHPAGSPATPAKPKHNYLQLLIEQHEQSLQTRSEGIDFRRVVTRRAWPFAQFVKRLAERLSRAGGLTAFTSEELEALQKIYQRQATLDERLLEQAVQHADPKTIPVIAYHLERLAHERLAHERS